MRRAWIGLFLLVIPAMSGCLAGGPLTGSPAPSFRFVTSEGQLVNETTYLGKFLILDLMATWCGPCKLEVAHLREVQRAHGDDVVILSVGTDPQETIRDLDAFGEQYGATWPYAIDRSGEVKAAMKMRIIPKLVIIDPEGVVVFEREGEVLPAAITRVIDPATRAPSGMVALTTLAALCIGTLAAFNPYRRLHREGEGGGPALAALGVFATLGLLAWRFSGFASTRATYGSLFVGALTLGAAAWWWMRARKRVGEPTVGTAMQRTSDRGYEMAPHFAAVLVLGLTSISAAGFFAPLFAFLVGAAGGLLVRLRLSDRARDVLGLAGLVLAGAGLAAYGARVFLRM